METETLQEEILSDGISLPNRLMYLFLKYNYTGSFKREVTSSELGWGKGYRYDFVIELPDGRMCIVEMQGRQHEVQVNFGSSPRTKSLKEIKESDRRKRQLALDNGIEPELYFEIDCFKSEPQYIIEKGILS